MVGRELRRRSGHDNLAAEVEHLKISTKGAVVSASHATVAAIAQHTAWAESAPLRSKPLISVIMPTRNRAGLLVDALDSLLTQSYPHWELVVVDDASTDATAGVLAEAAKSDGRIRVLQGAGRGAAAARNQAMADARGELYAFLDDDNTMARHWLRAIVEYFGRRNDVSAVYGAQLRMFEDESNPELRLLFRTPFDRAALIRMNYIDLGAFAARATAPELTFDSTLKALIDWEMFIRISEHTELHPLPVYSSMYTTTAQGRISRRSDVHEITRSVADRYSAPSANSL